jgi:hypothetical protein
MVSTSFFLWRFFLSGFYAVFHGCSRVTHFFILKCTNFKIVQIQNLFIFKFVQIRNLVVFENCLILKFVQIWILFSFRKCSEKRKRGLGKQTNKWASPPGINFRRCVAGARYEGAIEALEEGHGAKGSQLRRYHLISCSRHLDSTLSTWLMLNCSLTCSTA